MIDCLHTKFPSSLLIMNHHIPGSIVFTSVLVTVVVTITLVGTQGRVMSTGAVTVLLQRGPVSPRLPQLQCAVYWPGVGTVPNVSPAPGTSCSFGVPLPLNAGLYLGELWLG